MTFLETSRPGHSFSHERRIEGFMVVCRIEKQRGREERRIDGREKAERSDGGRDCWFRDCWFRGYFTHCRALACRYASLRLHRNLHTHVLTYTGKIWQHTLDSLGLTFSSKNTLLIPTGKLIWTWSVTWREHGKEQEMGAKKIYLKLAESK